ncbi:MAG: hypothetical protein WBK88_04520 [Methanothrix sp.]
MPIEKISGVLVRDDQKARHWDAITPTTRSAHIRARLDLADGAEEAVVARRALHDLQEGVPLIRREDEWIAAMDEAARVLRKLELLIEEEK